MVTMIRRYQMSLKSLRKRIDSVDLQILKLLNRRANVILEIGRLKNKSKKSVYVPEREKEVY